MNKRILIVDLHSVLHAIKFSLGKHRLSNKEKPTFVIYGFLLKMHFLLRKTRASIVVYALDSDTSIRKEKYSLYKESRQKKTDEQIALDEIAYPQFTEIKEHVLPSLGFRNIFGQDGYEADDIIGSICKSYPKEQLVICSTDQDMYQLLTDNCAVFDPKKNQWYTRSDFEREYGIEPKMWKRVKAIGGCNSDGVKGVPIPQPDPEKKQQHVAEKGALNFIRGDMKTTTKAYQAIISRAGKDVINRNKGLVILPMKGTKKFKIRPDHIREIGMRDICQQYGFASIEDAWRDWKKVFRMR